MAKGGFVNKGRCQYVYDPGHQTEEQQLAELWDEVIDFILALREIAGHNTCNRRAIAHEVLAKYGKTEEPDQT